MKHLFLNLKRFDIPPSRGGVNRLAPMAQWGAAVVSGVQESLRVWPDAEFMAFFPEAHLLCAAAAQSENSPLRLGCQGVYREDTAAGGNFGAFTTQRTASAARELGCEGVIIGHCEERAGMAELLALAGVDARKAAETVGDVLNREIRAAQAAGLRVLYCIGERSEEQAHWEETLCLQLTLALAGVDPAGVTVAYEPVWSIGPGKTPADKPYITKVARLIKAHTGGLDVVYGGGLKRDNAATLASIPELDGGLIALTRFQGEIGFYPEEYLEIVRTYLENCP